MFSFLKRKKTPVPPIPETSGPTGSRADPDESAQQVPPQPSAGSHTLPEAPGQPVPGAAASSEPSSPGAAQLLDETMPEAVRQPSPGWMARLRQGLSRTGQNISGLFVGVKVDDDLFDELETALIMADAGVEATDKLLTALRARVRKQHI